MPKTKTLAILGAVILMVSIVVIRYMNDFSRLKQVEISNTPIQLGTISNFVLANNQSSEVKFMLHCYFNVRSDGKPLFTKAIRLAPNTSMEFNVYPEISGAELPRIIPNKACEAVWQGPFGIRRSAWWVSSEYGKPVQKANF